MGAPEITLWTCPSCGHQSEPDIVKVRQPDRTWADSSIKCCPKCSYSFGGTISDRLAHVRDVYNYKYFGDGELSPAQFDAVGDMLSLAALVPDLLDALKAIVAAQKADYGNATRLHLRMIDLVDTAEAAILKAEGN